MFFKRVQIFLSMGYKRSMVEKKSKSEITAERLYLISMERFLKKGFDDTTMRDLAEAAELSPGAFYYHFPNKEAVVQQFYRRSFETFRMECTKIFSKTDNFETRFEAVLEARLSTFDGSRELLIVLSRSAVDPRSPLSPFGDGQKEIRDATVGIMREMMDSSDLKCDKGLRRYLPELFWMYLMGIMLFWVFDDSKLQEKTHALIGQLTKQVVRLIRFSRIPLSGTVLTPLKKTLNLVISEDHSLGDDRKTT
jgi:AcrR family transcriptional regulator